MTETGTLLERAAPVPTAAALGQAMVSTENGIRLCVQEPRPLQSGNVTANDNAIPELQAAA